MSRRNKNQRTIRQLSRCALETLEARKLLATAGTLDPSFSEDGKATASNATFYSTDVAVQTDGKTVVVGRGDAEHFVISRFNLDGTLDKTFGPEQVGTTMVSFSGFVGANAVAIEPGGKIVVAGQAE